jgi:L-fuconolactonase
MEHHDAPGVAARIRVPSWGRLEEERVSIVVDSHQHFWDPALADYPWMTDAVAPIRRRLMPGDLRPRLAEAGVDYTVLVQARSDVQETRELLRLAADTDFIAGVVGWVDLSAPNLVDTIDQLRELEGGGKLVGIRHQVHDESDERWLLRDDVLRGLRIVRDAGLAYDLLVRTRELPAALQVARKLDGLRFIIDHIAKPPIRSGQSIEWAEALAPFEGLPNVSCKISGMVTEADWKGWRTDDLKPYVERVYGWFGEGRCLFGSDWPVCLLAASYQQVLDACRATLGPLPPRAQARVFGENAIAIYRLAISSPREGAPCTTTA